jgi:hypothetical protein
MNKEEVLVDFLRGLRIVINNAQAYLKDHPFFRKSVEIFKEKLDVLLIYLNPIKIDITLNSLSLDGKIFDKEIVYLDLAQFFHFRQIKSIRILRGIDIKELVDFLSTMAMPKKEFFKLGGLKNIFEESGYPHILIEELDYSILLKDKLDLDTYKYILREAIENKDENKINELADNFDKFLEKFKLSDLLGDPESIQNISKFLRHLEQEKKEKFYNSINKLFTFTFKSKDIIKDADIEKIKLLFKDLTEEDLAKTLWDQLIINKDFDFTGLNLFSLLIDKEKHRGIANVFLNKTADKELLKNNPKVLKKIQDLLSSKEQLVSKVYESALYFICKDISPQEKLALDYNHLQSNFRFMLLTLLELEKNKERLNLIIDRINKGLEKAFLEKDTRYIRMLLDIVKKRKKETSELYIPLENLEQSISKFVEEAILKDIVLFEDLGYIIDSIEKTTLGVELYLEKIFQENSINPFILKLFFKFFPSDLDIFYKNLEKRSNDIEFIEKIIDSLKEIKFPLTLNLLKDMFSFSGEFTKIKILEAMRDLPNIDEEFIFSLLSGSPLPLKKEAMIILKKDKDAVERAIDLLLNISSFLGRKNRLILENMLIIEELNLKEATKFLNKLSKKHFFWNRGIRKRASQILNKWKNGKN